MAVPFWRSGRSRGADGADAGQGAGPEASAIDAGQGAGHEASASDAGQGAGHDASAIDAAMRRVAEQDTPENRRALFERLLDATLIAPAVENAPSGSQPALAMLEGKDGPVLAVFTGVDALHAWRPTGYTPVAVSGRTVFETAARFQAARIEVNPASVPRGWISRTEIAALAEGRVPLGPNEQLAPPRRVNPQARIGPPAVRPPEALIEAARRALESQPHAVAGWVFARAHGAEPDELMVGIELARGLDRETTEATMQAIVEETWARSADADRLRFTVVAEQDIRDALTAGAGELIFKR